MQNPEKLEDYNKRLDDRLENQEETQNVEKDWQNIKIAIIEAAKEAIQTQPRIIYNEWWDEECKEAIKEKNISRKNAYKDEPGLLKKNTKRKDVWQPRSAEERRHTGWKTE